MGTVVTTLTGSSGFMDGHLHVAKFRYPSGIVCHNTTTPLPKLFVADRSNHRIRMIDIAGQQVTTVAGSGSSVAGQGGHGSRDGDSMTAQFYNPHGVALDYTGTSGSPDIYVVDHNSHKVRKIDQVNNLVHHVAGTGSAGYSDGIATSPGRLYYPSGISLKRYSADPKNLYVADYNSHRIRYINLQTQVTNLLAGSGTAGYYDGSFTYARFNYPNDVAVYRHKMLYIADESSHRIRKLNLVTKTLYLVGGSGTASFRDGRPSSAYFNNPRDVSVFALTPSSDPEVYVADWSNHRVRKIHKNEVLTIAGSYSQGFLDGVGLNTRFYNPRGIAVDPIAYPPLLYVADMSNNRIRQIDMQGMAVHTIGGGATAGLKDGKGTTTLFNNPRAIVFDTSGSDNLWILYVADYNNHKIRKIDLTNKMVDTLAGTGGAGYRNGAALQAFSARFNKPEGLAMKDKSSLYVADTYNHKIRMIDTISESVDTTIAGSASAGQRDGSALTARFYNPYGLDISDDGKILYVCDRTNQLIRQIQVNNVVLNIAGGTSSGNVDGTSTVARMNNPYGIALDPTRGQKTFYVADYNNGRVREL
eukprot:jgi/Bigna1/37693/e_gw1.21.1.1